MRGIWVKSFILLLPLLLFALSANGKDGSPEMVRVDEGVKEMPPVSMPHWKHQELVKADCGECHHNLSRGKVYLCSRCHGLDENIHAMKEAMHKACRGCHDKEAKAGKNVPVQCDGCHRKGDSHHMAGKEGQKDYRSATVVFAVDETYPVKWKCLKDKRLVIEIPGRESLRKEELLYIYSKGKLLGTARVQSVYSDEAYTYHVENDLYGRVTVGDLTSLGNILDLGTNR